MKVNVKNEIGRLKRVMVHSPDGGLGKIIPTKAQEWLFEDIVHLETMRGKEYDLYIKLLLYFLDPAKIKGKLSEIDDPKNKRAFYKPMSSQYFNSDKVVEVQKLLADVLGKQEVRWQLVAAVCAHEKLSYPLQEELLTYEAAELANTLISGVKPDGKVIMSPTPNYIFTRDIGIVINEHILLTRFAKAARRRESILTKYMLYHHPFFEAYRGNILEVGENDDHFMLSKEEQKAKRVTLEGGDIMTVAPNHLLIGCSERTSLHATSKVIKTLFKHDVVKKVTVVKIPSNRAFMHIDTTFTQVKTDTWVIYAPFSRGGKDMEMSDVILALGEKPKVSELDILQFHQGELETPLRFKYLEDLLDDISRNDLGCASPTSFIYSGGDEFPYATREQWTDSCNVLALGNGVVLGYDRNDRTAQAFRDKGFDVIHAAEAIQKFEYDDLDPQQMKDTLILLPSAELSRARGGSHCISMPLQRDGV